MENIVALDVARLPDMIKALEDIDKKPKGMYDIYGNLIQAYAMHVKSLEEIVDRYEME